MAGDRAAPDSTVEAVRVRSDDQAWYVRGGAGRADPGDAGQDVATARASCVYDRSEPEPDIAVVALGNYDAEHPTSALLVIEVAETTLRTDRSKAAVYASSRIGEYWIVNLDARTIEVYSSPDRDGYAEARTLRIGDTLKPLALADIAIEVAEILPKS
ncbi:MAG TPA: Uma2 family endonuclease [Kofleriaceae bacterium]|jgi:Uma2 family endonuclease|nr:Uma2 family endonuclease [Kofleriaceae bacterium]